MQGSWTEKYSHLIPFKSLPSSHCIFDRSPKNRAKGLFVSKQSFYKHGRSRSPHAPLQHHLPPPRPISPPPSPTSRPSIPSRQTTARHPHTTLSTSSATSRRFSPPRPTTTPTRPPTANSKPHRRPFRGSSAPSSTGGILRAMESRRQALACHPHRLHRDPSSSSTGPPRAWTGRPTTTYGTTRSTAPS